MILTCHLAPVQISEMWVDQFRVDVIHTPRYLWKVTLSRQQLLMKRGELGVIGRFFLGMIMYLDFVASNFK